MKKKIVVVFILAGMSLGIAAGVSGYTFVYAKGYSYLTNNPASCKNCHVMSDYYESWLKSGHRHVAVCNSCHNPQDLVRSLTTKMYNGFMHSLAFTTGKFPDSLEIKPHNLAIVEKACRHCHKEITDSIEIMGKKMSHKQNNISCIKCHSDVGHE